MQGHGVQREISYGPWPGVTLVAEATEPTVSGLPFPAPSASQAPCPAASPSLDWVAAMSLGKGHHLICQKDSCSGLVPHGWCRQQQEKSGCVVSKDYLIDSACRPYEADENMTSVLRMGKWRLRGVKKFAQCHTGAEWQSWDPGSSGHPLSLL